MKLLDRVEKFAQRQVYKKESWVVCTDGCEGKFKSRSLKLSSEEIGGSFTRYYFNCPHCNKDYTSYYMTPKIQEITDQLAIQAEELQRLSNKAKANKSFKLQKQIEKAHRKWQATKQKALREQERVKAQFKGV